MYKMIIRVYYISNKLTRVVIDIVAMFKKHEELGKVLFTAKNNYT